MIHFNTTKIFICSLIYENLWMKNNEFSYFQNEIQLCTSTFFTAASSQFWTLLFWTRLLRAWNLIIVISYAPYFRSDSFKFPFLLELKRPLKDIHFQKTFLWKLLLSKVCQISNIFRDLTKDLMKKLIRKNVLKTAIMLKNKYFVAKKLNLRFLLFR